MHEPQWVKKHRCTLECSLFRHGSSTCGYCGVHFVGPFAPRHEACKRAWESYRAALAADQQAAPDVTAPM